VGDLCYICEPGRVSLSLRAYQSFVSELFGLRSDSVKWASLVLGIISVFAVARSVYSLSEDIRGGIGGGAIRLPAENGEGSSSV
jgi:hypothetical protein